MIDLVISFKLKFYKDQFASEQEMKITNTCILSVKRSVSLDSFTRQQNISLKLQPRAV